MQKPKTEPAAAAGKGDVSLKDAVKAALDKKKPPQGFPKQPSTKHKGGKT